jgi:hypothetical protein
VERNKKLNCWEFKKCGREPKGSRVHDLGVCPASEEKKLDAVHGGKNGGRSCWILSGTLCEGKVQGVFAQKYKSCQDCDFYQLVKKEEFPKFKLSAVLLKNLGQWPESE